MVDQTSMSTIKQTSKSAPSPLFLLAVIGALAVAIALPGAGQAAPGEPPNLAITAQSHDFGLVPVHSGAQTTVQVRNDGSEEVQLEPFQIVGDNEAFWVSDCGWKMLQPSEACFVQIYFNPQYRGDFAADLRVNAGGHQFVVELSGSGGQAVFAPESSPIDFGVAKVDSAGVVREIAVSNAGNMAGGVFIAVISGGAIGSYQLLDESCTGILLAPAATCRLQVRFQPLSEGVKKATLSLFGEGDGGMQIVLSGVGAAPDPEPNPPLASGGTAGSHGFAASATPSAATPPPHRPKTTKRKRRPRLDRRHRRHRTAVNGARLVLSARP